MAIFHESTDRIDYLLLQAGPVAKYWKREVLETDLGWLAEHGYRVDRLDVGELDEASLLRELGELLDFPDYYGQNLNALDDCLSDLEIPDQGGWVVVLLGIDRLAVRDPELVGIVLRSFARQSRFTCSSAAICSCSSSPTIRTSRSRRSAPKMCAGTGANGSTRPAACDAHAC
jgi:hypothetical protein